MYILYKGKSIMLKKICENVVPGIILFFCIGIISIASKQIDAYSAEARCKDYADKQDEKLLVSINNQLKGMRNDITDLKTGNTNIYNYLLGKNR